jgi:hypothetical protein
MLKNVEADTPEGKHVVDPPRAGIEAYGSPVNVVNAVNGKDDLLATTAPDAGRPRGAAGAAAVGAARTNRPLRGAA